MSPSLADLAGYDLGRRTVAYTDTDAMLYALCVGAAPDELSLVYERDLRVLPTFGLGLGLWAVEQASSLGAYDRLTSLHAAQSLKVHGPLPSSGTVEMSARVSDVWDKGSAAMIDIVVDATPFTATYSIFLPGAGGWGGDRGPSSPRGRLDAATSEWKLPVPENLAALYRLTGDRHPVHIDPDVAATYGFDRPILHGLCTLGTAALKIAEAVRAHPADLRELSARFAAPVPLGTDVGLIARASDHSLDFEAHCGTDVVLANGRATF